MRLGRFREDLYFRLNGALVAVPPLRERTSEIEPLATEFIRATCADLGRRAAPALQPESLLMLQRYAWPGNVRELKNFIERAVLVAPGDEILPEHFPIQRMASTLPLHRIGPTSRRTAAPGAVPGSAASIPNAIASSACSPSAAATSRARRRRSASHGRRSWRG